MIKIDTKNSLVIVEEENCSTTYPMASPEAFSIVSSAWLRCGWDNKYVYSFTWLGRPIIQLPEDMIRIQEVIYSIKPDYIIETGVAHGGSLVFYASILKAMGLDSHVIGIDIEIRPHNRQAIESHELYDYITLVEGNSISEETFNIVRSVVDKGKKVLVILDSNHTKSHVLSELILYSQLVSKNSYIVATDGIMECLDGAPRTSEDWCWNNPKAAAEEFTKINGDFIIEEPLVPFNEGSINKRVTYWPSAFLKKIR